jgi:hypothetical protein
MTDRVVYLAFKNDKVQSDGITVQSCTWCGNKTFIVVCQGEGFPMLKCSVCGNNIGKFGWAHDE